MNAKQFPLRFFLTHWLALLALACAATAAMAQLPQADPPARVAALSHIDGTVAFAPFGQTEWSDAVVNRPITRGDRVWVDPGARAELHLGSAGLHLASRTFVEVVALDHDVLQVNLNEGTVNARVRQLDGGENFEITTPHLAFRATQPGDYRIDVDPARGHTRVTVRSGSAMVYGAGAGRLQLHAGQQMAFAGRDLASVAVVYSVDDPFDRWSADRNRNEDQSIAARYVPREVVGYHELDAHGVWAQDPNYGAVWYPTITVADWAPYRYGHWDWIAPWGWTWIDDARWGFAPFHYGRWAQIDSRWCWVPGRIGRRPVYSPALVAFVGGAGAPGTSISLALGSGPGIGWFPLAPGETWRPTYRTSTVYLRNANRNAVFNHPDNGFFFQRRPDAITAVRVEDFSRGRPVQQHWNRMSADNIGRLQVNAQPVLPAPRRRMDAAAAAGQQMRPLPQIQQPAAPIGASPRPQFQPPGMDRREFGERNGPAFVPPGIARQPQRAQEEQRDRQLPAPAMQQGDRTQQIRQGQQERARRDQVLQPQRAQHEAQQIQQAQQHERAQRHQQAIQQQQAAQQHDRAQRHQQAIQQQQAAQQHERAQRHQQAIQQQQAAQHQERVQRQQQDAQERMQRRQEREQPRAMPPRPLPPQAAAPAVQPPPWRGEGRERAQERGGRDPQQREERAAQGEDEGGRGRGRGRFN